MELWASPAIKDQLRRTNIKELMPSYPANTEILDQYLQEDEDIPAVEARVPERPPTTAQPQLAESGSGLKIKLNLKRMREAQAEEANKRARTASPSPTSSDGENDIIGA